MNPAESNQELAAIWRDSAIPNHGDGVKHMKDRILGPISFEYSAFAVDGRRNLILVVHNLATLEDAEKISSLVRAEAIREQAWS